MKEFVEPSTDITAAALKGEHEGNARFGVWGVSASGDAVHGDSVSGQGVMGTSQTSVGIGGQSSSGVGVSGESATNFGVLGKCAGGNSGVHGLSDTGHGVFGQSRTNHAVHGESGQGRGVVGVSQTFFGVSGLSTSGVGVSGESATNFGVLGKCAGGNSGVHGLSDTGHGVFGQSRTNHAVHGESGQGRGVVGVSQTFFGVSGLSTSGVGVSGESTTGVGVFAKGGRLAGQFQGHVEVTGNIVVSGDIQLANADCAEDFTVAGSVLAEPGTVMVLNDEGELQASVQPYDRRVAGVVSGAGAYQPGLVLDRHDSARLRQPIGLLGKVFCKVDAQSNPIAVGDLLTTSPTPGHAMATNDPVRSFGAVIGKALRPLAGGRGVIPILITLQ